MHELTRATAWSCPLRWCQRLRERAHVRPRPRTWLCQGPRECPECGVMWASTHEYRRCRRFLLARVGVVQGRGGAVAGIWSRERRRVFAARLLAVGGGTARTSVVPRRECGGDEPGCPVLQCRGVLVRSEYWPWPGEWAVQSHDPATTGTSYSKFTRTAASGRRGVTDCFPCPSNRSALVLRAVQPAALDVPQSYCRGE